ncbi:LuxR C-terminal-related transcriptional regulator [Streptomyces virginiae]|uniref:LuxR C-terminal-related transcriptional regulator n=1 Tax=Streptomyces virginiae TaxID=1961 RepID=UPI00344C6477
MKRQTVDFTPREIEAVALLAEGRSAKEIAAAVGRSAETIRSRTERARHKVGAPTVACLLDYAYRKGVLPLPEPEQQGFKTSSAELAALRLAAQGRSNTQIAMELLTSRQNVVADLRKLRDRLGAKNHPQMVSRAWALRLLQDPDSTTACAQEEKSQ